MAQGHGAAPGVDPGRVHAQGADDRQGLGGKGLVELNGVHLLQGKAGLSERLGHRLDGADAHDLRRHAAGGKGDKAGQGLHAQLCGFFLRHEHHEAGTIGHLGGGGCGDGAVFQEAGLQPGQRLRGGVGADALVPADHHLAAVGAGDGDGDDLSVKAAAGLGLGGPAVALNGHGIHIGPADAPLAGHIFRRDAHGGVDLGAVLRQPGVGILRAHQHGNQRHGLHAAGDDHVLLPAADGVGGGGDGLQAGGAVAVDGLGGDAVGQPGPLDNQPGHIAALDTEGHGAAHDHVADVLRPELGYSGQHTQKGLGAILHGVELGKGALAGLAVGGAAEGDNHGLSQLCLHGNVPLLSLSILIGIVPFFRRARCGRCPEARRP